MCSAICIVIVHLRPETLNRILLFLLCRIYQFCITIDSNRNICSFLLYICEGYAPVIECPESRRVRRVRFWHSLSVMLASTY